MHSSSLQRIENKTWNKQWHRYLLVKHDLGSPPSEKGSISDQADPCFYPTGAPGMGKERSAKDKSMFPVQNKQNPLPHLPVTIRNKLLYPAVYVAPTVAKLLVFLG